MTLVRRPLIGLLALFVGALAIDRIALGGDAGRTIQTGAYLAAVVFVAVPLASPGVRHARRGGYLALAAATMVAVHAVGGRLTADPYLAIVETSFVVLAAGIAHHLSTALDRLDQTINSVVFGTSPALPLDGRQAANEILGEMARSRRHGRPLSVTVLAPDPGTLATEVDLAGEEVQRAVRERYVHGKLAQAIAEQLRRSDLLFEDPASGHFVVVSPETTAEGTGLLVERIRRALGPGRVRVGAGQATFPDHALTFEQLVEHAQQHMTDQPDPAGEPAGSAPTAAEGAA